MIPNSHMNSRVARQSVTRVPCIQLPQKTALHFVDAWIRHRERLHLAWRELEWCLELKPRGVRTCVCLCGYICLYIAYELGFQVNFES